MKISIMGLGYVGAVSAGCLAEEGHEVIGVDPQQSKVDLINQGRTPIIERDIGEMIERNVAAGRLLELQVPFQCLGASKDATVAFIVAINHHGAEVEHHPRHRPIEVQVPDERFPSRNWTA